MTVRRSMGYVAVMAIACVPLSWLTRAVINARESGRSSQCISNLKWMGLALRNYQIQYGCFPPAYVADAKSKPLYSWRALLMLYMDNAEQTFGGRFTTGFRTDEPWDSPSNRKLHDLETYKMWQCPSHPNRGRPNDTHFVAVVGPGTIFPGDGTSRRLADIKDGAEDTLIVVEVLDAGIHWMEPKELYWDKMSFRLNDPKRPSISGNHPRGSSSYPGPHVLTVDDMVTHLPQDLPPEKVKALLTISGGEKIERDEWYKRR